MQYDTIMGMLFYEFQNVLETYSAILEERKEEEEKASRALRFQVGHRPILVIAYENKWLTVGLSHWDINDEWIEYENNNLLNDYF